MSLGRITAQDVTPAHLRGAIVALGNFDGFHLGHQAVAARAIDWARSEGRPAIVATFDPHPVRHFAPDAPPFRLTSLDQRARLFAAAGADAMLTFGFDATLAATSATDFVRDLLSDRLGIAGVVTGEDFSFGRGRAGNVTVLQEIGSEVGLRAEAIGPVIDGAGPVSSSRIRDALKAGDPQEAARLMTRPFAIEGVVVHGDKVGRTLGYPTANIELGSYLRPRFGIYGVTGRLADGRILAGAANIGVRPTFDPPKELLEPHFLDFDGNLYGQTIEVAFRHFIRPEAKFAGLDELRDRMARDVAEIRGLMA